MPGEDNKTEEQKKEDKNVHNDIETVTPATENIEPVPGKEDLEEKEGE